MAWGNTVAYFGRRRRQPKLDPITCGGERLRAVETGVERHVAAQIHANRLRVRTGNLLRQSGLHGVRLVEPFRRISLKKR
jgi:hypothetical protein